MLRRDITLGVIAGILIGIGGSVYLACDNKYVGAVLFSVALLCICMHRTGRRMFRRRFSRFPEI